MQDDSFKAYVIERDADGKVGGSLTTLRREQLDEGDLLIRVQYSSINYKDALAATGAGKIIRRFPCVGGIDLVGTVVESTNPALRVGQEVIATGQELGVSHHGGYAEFARVPGSWAIPLPPELSASQAMAIGTAGFTAALAIVRMEHNGLTPDSGPVIVSGATGGVGGLAIDMLATLGYRAVALTGKEAESDNLRKLGAADVVLTSSIDLAKVRPLEGGQWAGAIDNVGGPILHWLLATTKPNGTVAAIGNAASMKLDTTVFPFILRAVSLLGIESAVTVSAPLRQQVWKRLAGDLKPRHLAAMTRSITLDELPHAFDDFLNGRAKGRTVVKIAP